jgi:hypothetical protein
MNRNNIIEGLHTALEPLPYAYALWLEGADANGTVDPYSDLDFVLDFEDAYETQAIEAVEAALEDMGGIDYKHIINHDHPQLRQRIYHLNGCDEYLMIDFCWQLRSREIEYIRGDTIEAVKVIFDKSGVIRYKDYNADEFAEGNLARLNECKYRAGQHCRILKYVRRGQYPEAFAYYNRYAVEPLVDLLRLIHTPAHADYHLVHISQHIPADELKKLDGFLRVSTLEDIEAKTREAGRWFAELLRRI